MEKEQNMNNNNNNQFYYYKENDHSASQVELSHRNENIENLNRYHRQSMNEEISSAVTTTPITITPGHDSIRYQKINVSTANPASLHHQKTRRHSDPNINSPTSSNPSSSSSSSSPNHNKNHLGKAKRSLTIGEINRIIENNNLEQQQQLLNRNKRSASMSTFQHHQNLYLNYEKESNGREYLLQSYSSSKPQQPQQTPSSPIYKDQIIDDKSFTNLILHTPSSSPSQTQTPSSLLPTYQGSNANRNINLSQNQKELSMGTGSPLTRTLNNTNSLLQENIEEVHPHPIQDKDRNSHYQTTTYYSETHPYNLQQQQQQQPSPVPYSPLPISTMYSVMEEENKSTVNTPITNSIASDGIYLNSPMPAQSYQTNNTPSPMINEIQSSQFTSSHSLISPTSSQHPPFTTSHSLTSPTSPLSPSGTSSPTAALSYRTPFYQTDLCNEGDERADALVDLLNIKPFQDVLSIIIHHVVSRRTWGSPLEYKQHLLAKEFHESVCEVPSWVNWDRIRNGQQVFWRYAWPLWISCIGSAMTRGATLPIPSPHDGKTPNQRLLETSQFLLECMFPDSLKPGNFGWSTAIRIRCAHSLSRSIYYKKLKEKKERQEKKRKEQEEELEKEKEMEKKKAEEAEKKEMASEDIQKHDKMDIGKKEYKKRVNNLTIQTNMGQDRMNRSSNTTNMDSDTMSNFSEGYSRNEDINEEEYQEMLPVSQADLIRTILYISLGSVSAMTRAFGIRMEKEELNDYVLLWRYISWLCGVDNQNNPLISLREGEAAANQLIAAESCMFLDDMAIKFTSAMLEAMSRIIPIFGRTNFVRAVNNELAHRLMGNEVVTNMKLYPKANETHRQFLKWFIQINRLACRVLAKNAFGKSLLCNLNRLVVPKMLWLVNGGKWVDFSRGCYSNLKNIENAGHPGGLMMGGGSSSNSHSKYENEEEGKTYASNRSSHIFSTADSVLSESTLLSSNTNVQPFNTSGNITNRKRRSQIRSMDGTLINESFIETSEGGNRNEGLDDGSQSDDIIYHSSHRKYHSSLYPSDLCTEEEEIEEEEWVQKPYQTTTDATTTTTTTSSTTPPYSRFMNRNKRQSLQGRKIRPQSWSSKNYKNSVLNQNQINNNSITFDLNHHSNPIDSATSDAHYNYQPSYTDPHSLLSSSVAVAAKLSKASESLLSKNENNSHQHPTSEWIKKLARMNMWAVVPAMSVAMAAYCVVLVYID